jgi:tetrahydromethanopterin S-methyltransferase subunit F
MIEPKISYPFGDVDIQTPDYAAAIALTIENQKTIVVPATLTGNLALTAAVAEGVRAGAELIVVATSDTTARNITLGSGFSGENIAGVVSGTVVATFVYDGTNFIHTATNVLEPQANYADVKSIAYAASVEIPVTQQKTIVTIGTLTGALTLTTDVDASVKAGAELHVVLTSDTTARDTTLSTGFTGTTVAGVISKTKIASFVYNGTNFLHVATQQVN